MSGLVEWESRREIVRTNEDGKSAAYSVVKYSPKIRKRPALVRRWGALDSTVAFFVSDDAARRFCDEILGGTQP